MPQRPRLQVEAYIEEMTSNYELNNTWLCEVDRTRAALRHFMHNSTGSPRKTPPYREAPTIAVAKQCPLASPHAAMLTISPARRWSRTATLSAIVPLTRLDRNPVRKREQVHSDHRADDVSKSVAITTLRAPRMVRLPPAQRGDDHARILDSNRKPPVGSLSPHIDRMTG